MGITVPDVITPIVTLERQARYGRALRIIDSLPPAELTADVLAAKSRLLNSQGRLVAALAVADLAADRWPGSAAAHAARAQCYAHDRAIDAVAAADYALMREPANLVALQSRAVALAELARHTEAEDSARRAVALAPDDADGTIVLAMVLLEANPSAALHEMNDMVRRDRRSTTLAVRAMVHVTVGDPAAAAADAKEAAALDPEHEMAAITAVMAAAAMEDWDDVIRRSELPVVRDNLTTNYMVALAHHAIGNHAEAERALVEVLDQQPSNLEMLSLLRGVQFSLHAWDRLRLTCGRILAIDPTNDIALLVRARAACEAGRPQSAIADLDQLLVKDPRDQPALAVRSLAYILLDRPTQAMADADAAIQAGAGANSLAYRARLLAHVTLNHRGEAERTARVILQDDPDDELARQVIEAVTARRQERIDAGIEVFTTVRQLLLGF
jgi:tetratricopeptide (TPR) repeat protein